MMSSDQFDRGRRSVGVLQLCGGGMENRKENEDKQRREHRYLGILCTEVTDSGVVRIEEQG